MDARLFHAADGGDIEFRSGVVMADGLETAAYLSLFGGNDDDDGSEATKSQQWWGNLDEPVAERRYRSATQATLRALPLTTANLRKVEDAARRDLAWLEKDVADSVTVRASLPARNEILLSVTIRVGDNEFTFPFLTRWQQQQ